MNLYEHTIVARQDVSPAQIKQLTDKYTKIIEKNEGKVVQTQIWGLINLTYIIKKNKKGNFIHFKFEGPTKTIKEIDQNQFGVDALEIEIMKKILEFKITEFIKNNEYKKDLLNFFLKNLKKNRRIIDPSLNDIYSSMSTCLAIDKSIKSKSWEKVK